MICDTCKHGRVETGILTIKFGDKEVASPEHKFRMCAKRLSPWTVGFKGEGPYAEICSGYKRREQNAL